MKLVVIQFELIFVLFGNFADKIILPAFLKKLAVQDRSKTLTHSSNFANSNV